MARIAGVNLPREKRVEIGLTYIFGIGPSPSQSVLSSLEIDRDTKVRDLTEDEVSKLRGFIDQNLMVEGDLRRDRSQNIKRLMEIGCYRGLRHRRALPVHGQRTKTNARTRKGPKNTVGNERRKEDFGRGRRARERNEEPALPPAPRRTAARSRARRKARKNIAVGQAHIKTSFNNTIVAITDREGNVIVWKSAGGAGFKGSRKSTPFAAQVTADACAREGMEHGLQKVEVFGKGPGSGRDAAVPPLQAAGLEVISVKDVTPQAHNGCRPRKRRRV